MGWNRPLVIREALKVIRLESSPAQPKYEAYSTVSFVEETNMIKLFDFHKLIHRSEYIVIVVAIIRYFSNRPIRKRHYLK